MTKTTCQDSNGLHCKPSSEEMPIEFWQQKAEKYRREYAKVRKSLGEYFMKFVDANIENIKLKNQLALAVDGLLKKISDIADYNQPVDDPMDKIHKAVNAANKKLHNNLEIAVDGIYKIAYPKTGTSADELINTARETLNKIKE